MLHWLRLWLATRQRSRVERLLSLAAQMDELLVTGKLSAETRERMKTEREQLEDQIHDLMTV
jgi:hypothetical protein